MHWNRKTLFKGQQLDFQSSANTYLSTLNFSKTVVCLFWSIAWLEDGFTSVVGSTDISSSWLKCFDRSADWKKEGWVNDSSVADKENNRIKFQQRSNFLERVPTSNVCRNWTTFCLNSVSAVSTFSSRFSLSSKTWRLDTQKDKSGSTSIYLGEQNLNILSLSESETHMTRRCTICRKLEFSCRRVGDSLDVHVLLVLLSKSIDTSYLSSIREYSSFRVENVAEKVARYMIWRRRTRVTPFAVTDGWRKQNASVPIFTIPNNTSVWSAGRRWSPYKIKLSLCRKAFASAGNATSMCVWMSLFLEAAREPTALKHSPPKKAITDDARTTGNRFHCHWTLFYQFHRSINTDKSLIGTSSLDYLWEKQLSAISPRSSFKMWQM